MFNVYSEELVLLILLAFLILGPRRLQHYARKLGDLVRELRSMAEGAKGQIKDELGPAFEDVDWRQLDPRQYDPRRIVREALAEPRAAAVPEHEASPATATGTPAFAVVHDPDRPTPFDTDAT